LGKVTFKSNPLLVCKVKVKVILHYFSHLCWACVFVF